MKLNFIFRLVISMFLLAGYEKISAQEVSYYFAAHPDDWQLFMGTQALADVAYAKIVFVTLTAGDAGQGSGGAGTIPYYIARENGSVKSSQFIANIGQSGSTLTQSTPVINGHSIKKYSYKNVVCYFLRLPDGNSDGAGFSGTNFQSLQKLKDGQITQIKAVDNSATYVGWADLRTLKTIITIERGTDPQVYINVPDTNTTLNSGDHSDHYSASFAAQDAVAALPWVGIASYIDYQTQNLAPNLGTSQIEAAAAMHACDIIGMTEGGYFSNWDQAHLAWLDKEYSRISRQPTGSAFLKANTVNAATSDELTNPEIINPEKLALAVFPNPVNRNATEINVDVRINHPDKVKFFLGAASGGQLIQELVKMVNGKERITISLQTGLVPGVYYLTALLSDGTKNSRLIVVQ